MFKPTALIVACTLLLASGPLVWAQEPATLVLKSGERVSGDLIDMGADFTMTVNGRERRIAVADVAVIDFVGGGQGLPDTETSQLSSERHLIVLRGGGSLRGSLYDISGTRPLRLIVNTDSGQRELSSAEVGRIYLARPPESALAPRRQMQGEVQAAPQQPPSKKPSPPQGSIEVSGKAPWTNTGLMVRKDEVITFTTVGEVQLSSNPDDLATADGARGGRYAKAAPMPQVLAGALIGRIGGGQPFAIGNQTIRMPAAGMLYLGINDDHVADNSGQFYVTITRQGERRR